MIERESSNITAVSVRQPSRSQDRTAETEADFRKSFEAHVDAVNRYCRRRARPDDAADAVSEVFLILWRRWPELGSSVNLPWLYGTARKVLANQRRSIRRRLRLTEKLFQQPITVGHESVAGEEVLKALDRLSVSDREVIRLSLWEDLSPTEIGQVVGCSPNAASMRLHRALDRLSQRLSSQEPSA